MTFDRTHAITRAATLSQAELELAIHVVCSAFSARHFPGVTTLDDVRTLVDVLSDEHRRRQLSMHDGAGGDLTLSAAGHAAS